MNDNHTPPLILVVEDVHETRYGMEKLLTGDGYRVSLARDEQMRSRRLSRGVPICFWLASPDYPTR